MLAVGFKEFKLSWLRLLAAPIGLRAVWHRFRANKVARNLVLNALTGFA
jgi:hypothetical protein